jgi:hypothetical protein
MKTLTHAENSDIPLGIAVDIKTLACKCTKCLCTVNGEQKAYTTDFKSIIRPTGKTAVTPQQQEVAVKVIGTEFKEYQVTRASKTTKVRDAKCDEEYRNLGASLKAKAKRLEDWKWFHHENHTDAIECIDSSKCPLIKLINAGIKKAVEEGRIKDNEVTTEAVTSDGTDFRSCAQGSSISATSLCGPDCNILSSSNQGECVGDEITDITAAGQNLSDCPPVVTGYVEQESVCQNGVKPFRPVDSLERCKAAAKYMEKQFVEETGFTYRMGPIRHGYVEMQAKKFNTWPRTIQTPLCHVGADGVRYVPWHIGEGTITERNVIPILSKKEMMEKYPETQVYKCAGFGATIEETCTPVSTTGFLCASGSAGHAKTLKLTMKGCSKDTQCAAIKAVKAQPGQSADVPLVLGWSQIMQVSEKFKQNSEPNTETAAVCSKFVTEVDNIVRQSVAKLRFKAAQQLVNPQEFNQPEYVGCYNNRRSVDTAFMDFYDVSTPVPTFEIDNARKMPLVATPGECSMKCKGWKFFGLYDRNYTNLYYSQASYNDIIVKSECWCGNSFGMQGIAPQGCSHLRRQESNTTFTLRQPLETLKVYRQPSVANIEQNALAVVPGAQKVTNGTCVSHGCKAIVDATQCAAASVAVGQLNAFETIGGVEPQVFTEIDEYSGYKAGCFISTENMGRYSCCRENRGCCTPINVLSGQQDQSDKCTGDNTKGKSKFYTKNTCDPSAECSECPKMRGTFLFADVDSPHLAECDKDGPCLCDCS